MIVAVGSVEQFLALGVPPGVDAAEIRLDLSRRKAAAPPLARALRPLKIIASFRLPRDGGGRQVTESRRIGLLREAAQWADYVDVESGVALDIPPSRIIRSFHDLRGMPRNLREILDRLRGQGGAIFKIAVTATRLRDNLAVRELLRGQNDVAAFCMGEGGIVSRVLAPAWGSRLTYGSLGEPAPAPGMIPAAHLAALYRADSLTARTRVFGVVGSNAMHSLSPRLHNAAITASRLNAVYLPLATRNFKDFTLFARELPLAGASVTHPFKQAAAAEQPPDAVTRATRAANTLVYGRRPRALNTDAPAFLDDLRAHYGRTLAGRSALVLGAGGAARAAVFALIQAGARVDVWARRPGRAAKLHALGARAVEQPQGRYDLLVNATLCGGASLPGVIALPWNNLAPALAHDALVYDIVYDPDVTALIAAARASGGNACNGLGMLHRQAALQARAFGYHMNSLRTPRRACCHLWLVGARGCGKSTLAPVLAQKLRRQKIDLDRAVERDTGMPVARLFAQQGEARFRSHEALALARAAKSRDRVIATGGGAVESENNIARMRDSGVVIWLDAPAKTLASRLAGDGRGRPSFTGKAVHKEVREILARRRPLYERAAHITIRADRPPHVLAGEIVDRLAQFEP